jgi:hypothetical protein
MANILGQLQQEQARTAQQAESLSERLNRMDAFQTSVDPLIRAQALDFSNRPTLSNPLDTIAGQLDLGERSRSQRESIASDLANARQQNLSLLSQIGTEQGRGGGGASQKSVLDRLTEYSKIKEQLSLNPELIDIAPDLVSEALGVAPSQFTPETPQGPSQEGFRQGSANTLTDLASLLQIKDTQIPKLTGEDKIAAETDLRKEFDNATKDNNFFTIRNDLKKIEAAQDTGAGDLSLIFSYMRMLDPTSAVKESEFDNAAEAASFAEKQLGIVLKLRDGRWLTPETKKKFLEQARALYQQSEIQQASTNEYYKRLAGEYGLDEKNIIGNVGEIKIGDEKQPQQLDTSQTWVQEALRQGFTPEEIQEYYSQKQ